jgi:hypothetical protein
MQVADLAYLAGVIDTQGRITTRRTADGTLLPMVAVSTRDTRLLRWLGQISGMRPVTTRRNYSKAGCGQHCPDKHQHIVSESGRWSVSGAKATIILRAVRPYLRLQQEEVGHALTVGLEAPFKPATPQKMAGLGWELPEEWS